MATNPVNGRKKVAERTTVSIRDVTHHPIALETLSALGEQLPSRAHIRRDCGDTGGMYALGKAIREGGGGKYANLYAPTRYASIQPLLQKACKASRKVFEDVFFEAMNNALSCFAEPYNPYELPLIPS